MRLKDELIQGGLTTIEEIGSYLDGLDHKARLREIHDLCPQAEATLYERAADAPPLEATHFVPEGVPDTTEVIHHGWNSLPAFRRFQKRFCRSVSSGSGDTAYFGYNHNPAFLRTIGITPGYFVMRPTTGLAHWELRGALVIDYHLTPDGPVAPGWPHVRSSGEGLQAVAFGQTRDFMRRVSSHVSIGKAYKHESPIGAYFVLCRED